MSANILVSDKVHHHETASGALEICSLIMFSHYGDKICKSCEITSDGLENTFSFAGY